MALTDDLKILDNRIKANQAQHDLGRETTKISVLSSKYLLEKYESWIGADLKNLKRCHYILSTIG